MLPAERPAIPNVAVTKVIAPSQGNSGELFNLKVSLDNQNDHAVDGVLTLTRNGQPFKTDKSSYVREARVSATKPTLPMERSPLFKRASPPPMPPPIRSPRIITPSPGLTCAQKRKS